MKSIAAHMGPKATSAQARGPAGRESAFDIIARLRVPARGVRDRRPREPAIKFLRMKPGHGEVLLAEGDPRLREDEERLVEEFRRQLDQGMWAAVPTTEAGSGRREALFVRDYRDIPDSADRVIFFPRASGG